VACLVLLSAGGLVYGAVLSARPLILLRAERRSGGGDVRVEDRFRVSGRDAARYLLEGGHVRRQANLDGNGLAPWDVVVARSLLAEAAGPVTVLAVGSGASDLPRALLAERADVSIDVLERNPAVVDLARDHFATAPEVDEAGRLRVRVGNLEDLLADTAGPYDLVLLDTSALGPLGGAEGLSRAARGALVAAAGDAGVLASGPTPVEPPLTGATPEWRATELRRRTGPGQADEVVVVSRRSRSELLAMPLGDFVPRNGVPPQP
jgi:hypothetical protein